MKLTFVVLALFLAIPALADGILPCAPDTAANYIAQGSCTEDQFTLKSFVWNGLIGTGTVNVPATEVLLTPATAGQFGLSFEGAGTTNPFSVSGTQSIQALFAYTIDPRPPILNGLSLTLSPGGSDAPVRPEAFATTGTVPFATITASICAGDTFADNCANGIDFIDETVDTRGPLAVNVDFPKPVSVVGIIMKLDMEANGGSISIQGGGTTISAVPEPGSAALALTGLGGLLALAYRRFRT